MNQAITSDASVECNYCGANYCVEHEEIFPPLFCCFCGYEIDDDIDGLDEDMKEE